jgi:hypothetical protein
MGFDLLFETHRDSLLNDLYYTLEVIDAIPELLLTADLSHFVIGAAILRLPRAARSSVLCSVFMIVAIASRAEWRRASRSKRRLEVAAHAPWVALFKGLWKDGLRSWRSRKSGERHVYLLVRIGSAAVCDYRRQSKLELSDRWREALQMREWVRGIWAELEREDAEKAGEASRV